MAPRFQFEDLTLIVPALWDKDWESAVANADERERPIVEALKRYSGLLRGLNAAPVTPAKVAWLSLWSRMFGCLTGVRGALGWDSRFPIQVLDRVAFETAVHIRAICSPMSKASTFAESVREEIRERLTGYLAWALRGDEEIGNHVGRADRVDASFDPTLAREMIEDLGDKQDWWRELSGQTLELVSDQESEFEKSKARGVLRRRQEGIRMLLSDRRVSAWARKLVSLERNTKGNVSLLSLLGEGQSVGSFTKGEDALLGYSGYLIGSHVIHGSSLRASLLVAPPIVAADFASLGGDAAELAEQVASFCSLHAVTLGIVSSWL